MRLDRDVTGVGTDRFSRNLYKFTRLNCFVLQLEFQVGCYCSKFYSL
jgi:hypothetical protein